MTLQGRSGEWEMASQVGGSLMLPCALSQSECLLCSASHPGERVGSCRRACCYRSRALDTVEAGEDVGIGLPHPRVHSHSAAKCGVGLVWKTSTHITYVLNTDRLFSGSLFPNYLLGVYTVLGIISNLKAKYEGRLQIVHGKCGLWKNYIFLHQNKVTFFFF